MGYLLCPGGSVLSPYSFASRWYRFPRRAKAPAETGLPRMIWSVPRKLGLVYQAVSKICGALALLKSKRFQKREGKERGEGRGGICMPPLPARAIESKCSLVFTSMHLCLLHCREQSPNSELILPCNMLKCDFPGGNLQRNRFT